MTDVTDVMARMPKLKLIESPTPFQHLDGLTRRLGGPDIFVKRDDLTGFALGGNKGRKLEYLMAAAKASGADTVITAGALQSNHCRQTAAAAGKLGLKSVLVLTESVAGRSAAYRSSGNLLLDRLAGAEIRRYPSGTDTAQAMNEVAAELKRAKRQAYVVPVGGSTPVGSLGYAAAAREIGLQAKDAGIRLDHVIHATGSAGTQTGLLLGFAGAGGGTPVTGICVSASHADMTKRVRTLLEAAVREFQLPSALAETAIRVDDRFVGSGYGQPTPAMIEAVRMLAECEGIYLDPVYSGKAMAGLIGLVREGRFKRGDNVAFVHTGGVPGLFVYDEAFPA
jgi:L-cysteate sulfo-lyase